MLRSRQKVTIIIPCLNEGKTLFKEGKYDEAIAVFKKGLKVEHAYVDFYNHIGSIYGIKKDYTNSIKILEKAVLLGISNEDTSKNLMISYEKIGDSRRLLELLKQRDYLSLHADVKRRDRLVGNDQFRVHRQCACDPEPLSLAAAELMRIAGEGLFGESDHFEQLGHSLPAAIFIKIRVKPQHLVEHVLDSHARI